MDKRLVLLTTIFFIFRAAETSAYYDTAMDRGDEDAFETPVVEDNPRAIATNGNYTVSFVPLISLLAGVVPRLLSRMRGTPTATARNLDMNTPQEFSGVNPCLDSILDRKPYPGSSCYFYECELYEPSNALCNIQTIRPIQLPSLDTSSASQTDRVRISKCLAIRIHKCAPSYVYDDTLKNCVKEYSNFYHLSCPI